MATIEERIDEALAMANLEQGTFGSDELYRLLKDPAISAAFDQEYGDCACCGRLWPLDTMEEPDEADFDGPVCHYCVD